MNVLDKPKATSFEQQITAALPKLKAYGTSLCRDSVLAEDLVQETVLKACANRDSFQEGTNFDAWVFTILKHHYLSTLRKDKRLVEDVDDAIAIHTADERTGADEGVGDELTQVSEVLNTIPKEQREALLAKASGKTLLDIAKEQGVEEGTVKSRINRAREQLSITQFGGQNRFSTKTRRAHLDVGGKSRFRKIDAAPFGRPPEFITALGSRPQLMWLPLTRMFIDESYQRNVLERGRANVYRIAKEFDWKKFSAVVVAKVGDKYAIVDGRHRIHHRLWDGQRAALPQEAGDVLIIVSLPPKHGMSEQLVATPLWLFPNQKDSPMAYLQKGASYTHKPKFIDAMKRAEGGGVDESNEPSPQERQAKKPADYNEQFNRAKGGSVHMTAGAESGPGRIQKEEARERNAKHEHPQKV